MFFNYVFLAVGLLWVISESFIGATKNASPDSAIIKDKGSVRLLNIVTYSTILLAFWINTLKLPRFSKPDEIASWCGIAVILLGLAFRWCAILKLKKYFTVNVAILDDHQLLTSGLYRYIRHPAYLGVIIAFCGMGLALGSYLAMAVLVIPVTLVFLWRIHIEEQALLAAFPESYRIYQKTSWRLIPLII
ncbi:methyltransferase family protein [Aeromonas hydrophila]|uniref:methyltransferase family protein n=1 Tax=Aeromonas hydrophila TaxID=644 RepID=UPI00188F7299|nr:isoprenylcysteine carboxylmethyltransferase family protein [Aeromonas hydrophila]MBF4801489.1 isoprenylcysteine carboxylmethyltransferase family protein [Aeromonas hydrophila]